MLAKSPRSVRALYADEVAALCRYGAELLDATSPIEGLFAWLDAFVVHVAEKRSLALAATDVPDGRRTPMFSEWHDAVTGIAADLVRRAQSALRPEVTPADVLALASGAALAAGTAHARRLVALLRTGVVAANGKASTSIRSSAGA